MEAMLAGRLQPRHFPAVSLAIALPASPDQAYKPEREEQSKIKP